ncbi:MAG: hypothetical protein ACPG5T_05815 [Endozoicomonas sp.]
MLGGVAAGTQVVSQKPLPNSSTQGVSGICPGYMKKVERSFNEFQHAVYGGACLLARRVAESQWCPLKGTIQYFQSNLIEKSDVVLPDKVLPDTAVLLMNNKHSAILMGGYDAEKLENPHQTKSSSCSEHIFSWYPKKGFTKTASQAIGRPIATLSGPTGTYYALIASGTANPVKGVCLIYSVLTALAFCGGRKYNPLRKLIDSILYEEGVNLLSLKENIQAIPLNGLNIENMKLEAKRIKASESFSLTNTNCSETVLAIIKAGLPEHVAGKIRSPRLWATPKDVVDAVHSLAQEGWISEGEVDDEGDIWFDA